MPTFTDIQNAFKAQLQAHPGFPAGLSIVARREKEVANNIEAGLAKQGICLWVLPPIPKEATHTQNEIIFFEHSDIRVRIIEQPVLNRTGMDVWSAFEQIANALQGKNPGMHFAAPIGLAHNPVETLEGEMEDVDKKRKTTRVWDVIFDGAFQLDN